ncbi:MAG: hypothetical protein V1678_00625 [Candidatus Aenigmatarchaeota archaeon]
MKGEREIIAYNPKEILNYTKKRGKISIRDLQTIFGYNSHASGIICTDLFLMGLFKDDDYEIVDLGRADGKKRMYRTHILTKVGDAVKEYELCERIIVLEKFPVLSDVIMNTFNKAVEQTVKRTGVKDFLELPDRELKDNMKEALDETVKNLGPVELYHLEKERNKMLGIKNK